MIELAPDLYQLTLRPRDAINVYLMAGVLVDSGLGLYAKSILRQLQGRTIDAHALTHCHPDHVGSTKKICASLDIPLWCGVQDVAAMESGDLSSQIPEERAWVRRIQSKIAAYPVRRALTEGDEVGGFTVLETPGHTPGHVAFWRESDRVLILGDVIFNMNPFILKHGLREPFYHFTTDNEQNRTSMRRLAALEPALICFGHGRPLRDTEAFHRFVASLAG